MLDLRDYQIKMLEDLRAAMQAGHRSVLSVLPTGSGKTVISGALSFRVMSKDFVMWFVCHRDFLLHQTSLTFDQMDVPHGFIAAGRETEWQPVMICSQQTLYRRLRMVPEDQRPRLIIWDEAHHVRAKTWETIFSWAGPHCRHIGLTATPERLDGMGLGPPFDALVEGPSTKTLMDALALSRYRAFAPGKGVNLKGVQTVAGDYNQAQLAKAVEKSVIYGDVVKTYKDYGEGRRAVYFCVGIPYSKMLEKHFNEAGIPALHVDGGARTDQRIEAARAFARGDLQVLTNCSLFGEGYDLAAQAQMDVTIDVVGLVRPTKSTALHLQQIGRALRPKPYPAIILDHAQNIARHGFPDEMRIWSLEGRAKRTESTGIWKCESCAAYNPPETDICECCGVARPHQERGGPNVSREGINEISAEEIVTMKREHLLSCRTLNDYREYALRWKMPMGWAEKAYRARPGTGQWLIEQQAMAYRR